MPNISKKSYVQTGKTLRTISLQEMFALKLDGSTYQQIADKAGISRQRVQILLSPPPKVREVIYQLAAGRCQSCGILVGRSGHIHHIGNAEEIYNDLPNLRLLCMSCHRKAHSAKDTPPHYCLSCGKQLLGGAGRRSNKSFCDRYCLSVYHSTTLTCEICGTKFSRKNHLVTRAHRQQYKHCFCSKQCCNKFLSVSGVATHPEMRYGNR